jgi:putative ABC transport system permease protein
MKFLASLRARGSALFHSKNIDAEMDEEMRLHIQNRAEDLERSGLSRGEAERRARIEFGGVERFKEEVRDVGWETHVENLFRDLRHAVRSLWKDKRFAFVAVFALALGIGASTVVFSVFYNLMFNAFAAKDANRLVVPVVQDAERPGDDRALSVSLADLDVIRAQNRVFENVVGYTSVEHVLAKDGSETYQFFDTRVTSDALEFYGVPALLGRGIAPDDGKPSAPAVFVMSYRTWKGTFHEDPKVLGKILTIDDEPRLLVGVMPPRFQAFGSQTEIWIPVSRATWMPSGEKGFSGETLARLKPGVSQQAASADLDVIVRDLAALHPSEFPKHFKVRVESATDYLLAPRGGGAVFRSDIKHLLYDLLAAVSMLLLIACGNVANLLLARATIREKEMAVRTALGATRGRLVRLLLVESSVLAVAALVVGCLFAWLGVKFVPMIMPRIGDIYGAGRIAAETGPGLNPPVLFFALGLTLVTTIICGVAPALHVARTDLQPQLSGAGRGGNNAFRHGKFRAALVVAEVTFSIVLLVGSGLMMRSFYVLTHVDLGFNPKNVLLTFFVPPHTTGGATRIYASERGRGILGDVVERLKALPGVRSVAVEDTIVGYGPGRGLEASVPGSAHSEETGLLGCDESLLDTLEMRLIRGQWLSEREVTNAQYVGVINQRLARDFFGDADPVGQQIRVKAFRGPEGPPQDAEFQIVGVVGDIKNAGPQQPAMPMIFLPYTVRGGFVLLLKTTVDPGSLRHAVQEQVWAVDRDEIVGMASPLEDFLQRFTYSTPEFGLFIAAPLASISLLLVIIGVFSVMAYTVSLQTQEIGVRMALGAQQGEILRMVLRRGAGLITAGIVFGLLASYGLTRFLASQIWGVSATDPWTFGAVVALVVMTGLAACLLPARRAASVDPLVALRYE